MILPVSFLVFTSSGRTLAILFLSGSVSVLLLSRPVRILLRGRGFLFQSHGKTDPGLFQVYVKHADVHDIADAHRLQRVADEFLSHLGNVHQAVLMNADVHKGAKVDDVPHGSLEDHAGLQILHFQNVGAKDRARHLFTRIAARLFQLGHDIPERDLADTQLFGHGGIILHLFGKTRKLSGRNILRRKAQIFQKAGGRFIGFRMDAGGVKGIGSAHDAQEARALLEGLGSQLRNL